MRRYYGLGTPSGGCTAAYRGHANFHEKALFVKADVAAPFVVERNGSMSFALCFHPHF